MKRILLFSLLSVFLCPTLSAQNADSKWAIGLGYGTLQYKGEFGDQFNKFSDWQNGFNIYLSHYLSPSFDALLDFNYNLLNESNLSKNWEDMQLDGNAIALNLNFRYKLNNGYILKEASFLQPYLTAGIGYLGGSIDILKAGNASTATLQSPDNIGTFDLYYGLGTKVKLSPRASIFAEVGDMLQGSDEWDASDDDSADGNDNFRRWRVGVAFSLGKTKAKEKDSDNDGVPDIYDICPNIKGLKENDGCPEVPKTVIDVFERALRGIYFETNEAIIKSESYPILDEVYEIMKENPHYKLNIAGHTDSDGETNFNQKLSERRAAAVKKYLVNKGIQGRRMSTVGYGETKPVADNSTAEGKALNRRVEFTVNY